MKLVLLSDTHNKHRAIMVPEGDVLIHAGDSCGYGNVKEFMDFIGWFSQQPHEHKVMIAGNHDRALEKHTTRYLIPMIKDLGVHYLEDSFTNIDGIKFYGAPWQPAFCNWAFNLPRGNALKEKWDLIPNDTDVLITHGPPWAIGDTSSDNKLLGCEDLLRAVQRVEPALHIFGHIHESFGSWQHGKTLFINASNLNDAYHYVNQPVVVSIDPTTKLVSPLVQR